MILDVGTRYLLIGFFSVNVTRYRYALFLYSENSFANELLNFKTSMFRNQIIFLDKGLRVEKAKWLFEMAILTALINYFLYVGKVNYFSNWVLSSAV